MGRVVVGLLAGMLLSVSYVEAIRIPKPPTITQWDDGNRAQLNAWLELVWQLTNGRYTVDVTTTNPNSDPVRTGTQGDIVFYNNGGSYKLCVNTSDTTPSSPTGTTWRCSANAFSAP